MEPKAAFALVEKNEAILIDVREEQELKESGIVACALWMPVSKISDNHEDWKKLKASFSKDKQILLYCRSGARSGRITELLCCEGLLAVNVGGFAMWAAAGIPVKKF